MYLVNLGSTVSGWYAYAPLSQAVYPPHTGLAGWLRLIIWLALAARGALVLHPGVAPLPGRTAKQVTVGGITGRLPAADVL